MILGCAFVDMLNVGLALPVLPILIGEFVSEPRLQAIWFGILTAVFGLMQFVFAPMLGALSDRIGRKPVLMLCMLGMSINFATTSLASGLAALFVGRVIGGMTAASLTVILAYGSDVSRAEERPKVFGRINAAFALGFICGPAIGGLLADISLRLPFASAALLSALNLAAVHWLVVETTGQPRPRRSIGVATSIRSIVAIFRRRDVRDLAISYGLAIFAQILIQTTWVLYTTFKFGWSPMQNGIALLCLGTLGATVQAVWTGPLAKSLGIERLALVALAFGAVSATFFGLAAHDWMLYAVMLLSALAFAAAPALQGAISGATDERDQGEMLGALQALGSLGVMTMPLIGNLILGRITELPTMDWRAGGTFYLAAIMQATAFILVWWSCLRATPPATHFAPKEGTHS